VGKLRPSFKNFFCYPLEAAEAAKAARMPALVFSIIGAAIWSIIAIVGFFSPSLYGHWSILYALLFILISFGLIKMRREAAIAGFLVSLFGLLFYTGATKAISDICMLFIDALAIRGTFAYLRLNVKLKNIHSV
jgi:hypothetical protein